MKTLNWRYTDWWSNTVAFSFGRETIGQLSFSSYWNFKAVYSDKENKFVFSQKSFWDTKVLIRKNERVIGEIDGGFFVKPTLKLLTGEKFEFVSNFWGKNNKWKNHRGEVVIRYTQATMSSMGKGTINLSDSLTTDLENLLVSSGLFIRHLIVKTVVLTVAIFVPMMAVSRR